MTNNFIVVYKEKINIFSADEFTDKNCVYFLRKLLEIYNDINGDIYCDSNFSFPIIPRTKPLKSCPQLITKIPDANLIKNLQATPRLEIISKDSPKFGCVCVAFYQKTNPDNNVIIRCPLPNESTKLDELISMFGMCSKRFTWKNLTNEIGKSVHVSPQKISIYSQIDGVEVTHSQSKPVSFKDIHLFNEDGSFVFTGKFYYDIIETPISSESKATSQAPTKSDYTFVDTVSSREAFYESIPNLMKTQISLFQEDIISYFSSGDLSQFFILILTRITREFCFDSNDSILIVALKYFLSSSLSSIFSNLVKLDSSNQIRTWKEMNHAFLSCKSNPVTISNQKKSLTSKEFLTKVNTFYALSLTCFVERIVDVSYKISKYFNTKTYENEYEFFGPIIYHSNIYIDNEIYLLILTRGFIFIIEGKSKSQKNFEILPTKFEFELNNNNNNNYITLPLESWNILSLPTNTSMLCILCGPKQQFTFSFSSSEQMLDFTICFHMCKNVLEISTINPIIPLNTSMTLQFNQNMIISNVTMGNYHWNISFDTKKVLQQVQNLSNDKNSLLLVPTLQSCHIPFSKNQKCSLIGCNISLKKVNKLLNNNINYNYNSENSLARSIIWDLIFSYSKRARFEGLYLFKISDFSISLTFNSSLLLKSLINYFPNFISDFKIDEIPFLHYSCKNSDNLLIIQILCKYVPINKLDKNGENALFYAISNPNLQVMKILIDNNININQSNKNGITPLIKCIINKDLEKIEFLLKNGAKVNDYFNGCNSALEYVIKTKDIKMIKILLSYVKEQINIPNINGAYILHQCIINDFPDAIYLIQNYCNDLLEPNLYSYNYPHPLCFLFNEYKEQNIKLLIALLYIKKLRVNVKINKNNLLIKAIENGYDDYVRILAEDIRCDLDDYNDNGLSALYIAVKENKKNVVKILIQNGVLIDQPTAKGKTAVMKAIKSENEEILEMLLKNGANVNQWFLGGKLPVSIASKNILNLIKKHQPNLKLLSFEDGK